MRPPLVIGVGNRDRGDDAVGPLIAEAIGRRSTAVDAVVAEGDLSDLTLHWHADHDVVVVDAMSSGRAPGSIVELDACLERLAAGNGLVSSHGIGLAEAVELGRLLGRLPRRLTIIGVEAATFDQFDPITPSVAAAVPAVVERVAELLGLPRTRLGQAVMQELSSCEAIATEQEGH